MSRYFDMPGIDIIFPYHMINYYDFNVTPKYVSSAAHFLGRGRVLSETYTGSTWAITLREMKRIANRLFLFGVNYIQFMGAYYSINNYHKSYDGACPINVCFSEIEPTVGDSLACRSHGKLRKSVHPLAVPAVNIFGNIEVFYLAAEFYWIFVDIE